MATVLRRWDKCLQGRAFSGRDSPAFGSFRQRQLETEMEYEKKEENLDKAYSHDSCGIYGV